MIKHYIIPIFVPHLGCPHDCVFCNQRRITNAGTDIGPRDVEEKIEEYLSYFDREAFIEVAFFGGSFTAIDINIQKDLLEVAYKYKKKGLIDEIRMSTRPDAIDDNILKHLKEYEVDTIELGVQSMDNQVLNASGRGHLKEDVYKACSLIKNYDIKLGLQMMLGLPKDNLEKDLITAKEFIKLEPDCVRIYPTLVIKDTYLAKLLEEEKYQALSLDQAVDISTKILILFYLNNINVIRVGLQATDNIQMGKDIVAGPFHPAFRQFVESNIYKIIIEKYIIKNPSIKNLEIKANNKIISDLVGQKARNTKYFKEEYSLENISIVPTSIDKNIIILDLDGRKLVLNKEEEMKSYILNFLKETNKFSSKDFNLN